MNRLNGLTSVSSSPTPQPPRAGHSLLPAAALGFSFGFTGWLLSQGYQAPDAMLITFGLLAGTMAIMTPRWGGLVRALRRMMREDPVSDEGRS